jgi:hypothetical protein
MKKNVRLLPGPDLSRTPDSGNVLGQILMKTGKAWWLLLVVISLLYQDETPSDAIPVNLFIRGV